jgi:hypothetical protein
MDIQKAGKQSIESTKKGAESRRFIKFFSTKNNTMTVEMNLKCLSAYLFIIR